MGSKRNKPKNLPGNTPKQQNPALTALQEKREEAINNDERVKVKVAELEAKIKEVDESLAGRKEELEKEYAAKLEKLNSDKEKLEQQKADIEKREDDVLDAEKSLYEERAKVREETIAEIRADEDSIRSEEYEQLKANWSKEESEAKENLEFFIRSEKEKTESELAKAKSIRESAEKEKLDKLAETDRIIEQKYEQLTGEYQAKIEEYAKAKAEYTRKKNELAEEQADLDEDKAYIADLKKKYEAYSETEVLRLQQKIAHLEEINKVSQETISAQSSKIAKLQIKSLDRSGQTAQDRIEELEQMLDEATEQLDAYANLPSPARISELELHESERNLYKAKADEEKEKYEKEHERLTAMAFSTRELENARASAAALEALNDQLQKKLQYISEQYKSNQENKFQGLLEIDAESSAYIPERKAFSGSLKQLVDYIRNYGADPERDNPLYYSKDTIRVFIASLAASEPASRLLILQGLSGTGKSSLPALVGEALDFNIDFVSVQPSWRDNRELLGYDNDFTNRFKETEFTKCLYRASTGANQNRVEIIVLDEMNLARIEYYFADFLSTLEHRDTEWMIPLISSYNETALEQQPRALNYSNGTANLVVTKNIWFVGTANNDDSTSLITDKVYDRAQVLDMDKREKPFVGERVKPVYIDLSDLHDLFASAKKNKEYRMNEMDWENLDDIDEYLKKMDITFGNRIKNQLEDFVPVFVACGGTKEGAVDYFLAHKILRKLDEKYDAYLYKCLDELVEALNTFYGEGVFAQSLEKIQQIKQRNFNVGEE